MKTIEEKAYEAYQAYREKHKSTEDLGADFEQGFIRGFVKGFKEGMDEAMKAIEMIYAGATDKEIKAETKINLTKIQLFRNKLTVAK